jgi:YgiT-type zinc finger domain-containing protein
MTCAIYKTGNTQVGVTKVTLQRGSSVIVIKGVPARVCEDCGEYYLAELEAQKVYALAESAAL